MSYTPTVESVTSNYAAEQQRLAKCESDMVATQEAIKTLEGDERAKKARFFNVLADEKKRRVRNLEGIKAKLDSLQA